MNRLVWKMWKHHQPLFQSCSLATRTEGTENIVINHLNGADAGVSILNLNKRERKNALSIQMLADLNKAIDSIRKHDMRVLVIKSTVPGTFCAGADLKERLTLTEKELSQYNIEIRSTMTRIAELPIPVLAAIDGYALGGGLELALACDIRIVSNSAKLGLVETGHGIIPGAGGTARLPRTVNPAVAKELIFTAKIFDGIEAKALGVANHVVSQNEEGNAAYLKSLDIARKILPNGPIAIRAAKFVINKGIEVNLNSALAFEEAGYARTIPTKDRVEGLKAFVEKRCPKYNGE
ncbi:hypothetical protein RI129_009631 [Pyrocoelia pectoralis]|uniref:Uncharacterized protein n=1 Tax=Pyrocoelia pectoralis TaxID=417401 RepID=A0AAN7VBZ4_9COLE